MKHLLLIVSILAASVAMSGQRTISPKLRPAVKQGAESVTVVTLDTLSLAGDSLSVRFYGYEKTLRATKETLFVLNSAGRDASELRFTIVYFDAAGREIHRRRVTRRADFRSGHPLRLDIPSWDTQKTFYFSGGPRPRVSATPFSVKIIPDTIILLPHEAPN